MRRELPPLTLVNFTSRIYFHVWIIPIIINEKSKQREWAGNEEWGRQRIFRKWKTQKNERKSESLRGWRSRRSEIIRAARQKLSGNNKNFLSILGTPTCPPWAVYWMAWGEAEDIIRPRVYFMEERINNNNTGNNNYY